MLCRESDEKTERMIFCAFQNFNFLKKHGKTGRFSSGLLAFQILVECLTIRHPPRFIVRHKFPPVKKPVCSDHEKSYTVCPFPHKLLKGIKGISRKGKELKKSLVKSF